MSAIQLDPYLFFQGNCKEAMEFYKDVFGGELTMTAYKDTPGDFPGKAERLEQIMHANLKGGAVTLMAADTPQASAKAAKIELSLSGDDEGQLRAIFDKLAVGGNVKMKLEKQFWGDVFGNLTDKYNIDWMVNINQHKA
jgi:PhnB protein